MRKKLIRLIACCVMRRMAVVALPSGKALKAQDLRSELIQKKTDDELVAVITNGKGKMPAFGKKLKPDQIAQLVAYIRALPKK